MAATVQCPDCSTWNPPQATRCRNCGRELRGPDVRFDGPPPDARKPRSVEDEKADVARKAAAHAASARAMQEQKREEERKRKAYMERKARLKEELAASQRPASGPAGAEPAPRVAQVKARKEETAAREPPPTAPGIAESGTGRKPAAETAAEPRPKRDRVRTFVRGFDEALGGGIPNGFVVVIEGSPGTMKSSLGFWILAHNCAEDGHRALYISCEENTASLLRQMEALGVDLAALGDRLKVLDPPLLRKVFRKDRRGDWLLAFQGAVAEAKKDGCDLLVIDSLDALEVLAKIEDRRQELFRLFEWLRDFGMTTFAVAERPDYVVQGHVFLGRYDEDFLADGVMHLRLHLIAEQDAQRRIRIVKMRGTKHETGYLALHVARGEFEVGRVLSA